MRGWGLGAAVTLGAAAAVAAAQRSPKPITVESVAFKPGAAIPIDFTADGKNLSPPLSWGNLPQGTRELAVIVENPDAPTSEPFVHWVVYKIPATASGLPEGIPAGAAITVPGLIGALQGPAGLGAIRGPGMPAVEPGYRGPAPPPGTTHQYRFIVYALAAPLEVGPGLDKAALIEAMAGKIIGEGALVGVYERPP